MKWKKFTIQTTTAAEDFISEKLSEIGIEGIEIEDKVELTASIVLVQFLTDFCDRAVSLALVMAMVRVLPVSIKQRLAAN